MLAILYLYTVKSKQKAGSCNTHTRNADKNIQYMTFLEASTLTKNQHNNKNQRTASCVERNGPFVHDILTIRSNKSHNQSRSPRNRRSQSFRTTHKKLQIIAAAQPTAILEYVSSDKSYQPTPKTHPYQPPHPPSQTHPSVPYPLFSSISK